MCHEFFQLIMLCPYSETHTPGDGDNGEQDEEELQSNELVINEDKLYSKRDYPAMLYWHLFFC